MYWINALAQIIWFFENLPHSVIHTLSVWALIMHRLVSYKRLFLGNTLIYSPLGCPFSVMGLQPHDRPKHKENEYSLAPERKP